MTTISVQRPDRIDSDRKVQLSKIVEEWKRANRLQYFSPEKCRDLVARIEHGLMAAQE
jgi:hypothetical protein